MSSKEGESLLFVYGTLMQKYPKENSFRDKLAARGHFLGVGRAQGRIYLIQERDFRYPAMVRGSCAHEQWVYGELWNLEAAHSLWAELDEYEGVDPVSGEYERALIPVQNQNQLWEEAWAYLYRKEPSSLFLIPGGRFLSLL